MNNKYQKFFINNNSPRSLNDSILLIDGLNTFLRNHTAINHINQNGEHIGGVTGTLKSIGYGIKLLNPTKTIIIFDGPGSYSNKRNLYPNYKANRNKNRIINYKSFLTKDDENISINNQISRLIQYLKCLPISIISIDGLEADDVIGYLVEKYEKTNTKEINIISADKDFLQLASKKTSIYSPSKKKLYKPDDVLEEYGVKSNNFIWYKTLLGDSSDNIPGVYKLGSKKIHKLYPELKDNDINFDFIIKKAEIKKDENILYENILNSKKQLEINYKLMSLQNIPISNENKDIIEQLNNLRYEYNPALFYQMYIKDVLGREIFNVSDWLSDTFSYLSFYK